MILVQKKLNNFATLQRISYTRGKVRTDKKKQQHTLKESIVMWYINITKIFQFVLLTQIEFLSCIELAWVTTCFTTLPRYHAYKVIFEGFELWLKMLISLN